MKFYIFLSLILSVSITSAQNLGTNSGQDFKVCDHMHDGTRTRYAIVEPHQVCPLYSHTYVQDGKTYTYTFDESGIHSVAPNKVDRPDDPTCFNRGTTIMGN